MSETSNDFPKLGINTESLLKAAEDAIEEARAAMEAGTHDFGAVNWGDIGVRDIEYRLSMLYPNGGPFCTVTLEEASPDCGLSAWVSDSIIEHGFNNVHVECEW